MNFQPDNPRSLRDPEVRAARRAALGAPHILPLTRHVRDLRERSPAIEFPDFDPLDGGVEARLLFLMEKPGPMTSAERDGRQGSGFISRDNDDPTAQAIFTFMREAGIPRRETVLWNLIPGWNRTTKVTGAELTEGIKEALRLTTLLPRLKGVVFVGSQARKLVPHLTPGALSLHFSLHPSRTARRYNKTCWELIPDRWRAAYEAVEGL